MDQHRFARVAIGIRVTVLAVTVGALVAAVAVGSGTGSCRSSGVTYSAASAAAESSCLQLVRVLSERVGVATAAATLVILLTTAGLSRLSQPADRPMGRLPD